ncbi:MAG: indolepyruvate ferredoxin oxidoreductase family protein, partial [Salinisphaera sp.]|nr:indolepyruvate ferredoxin oxidoreductase family protein [Salinisphaera sp.]
MWQAEKHLKAADIHFQPGVNEDLAATAAWGTQQVGLGGHSDYDGVFAIWYGKGPGVDRSGDPFKHGNLAGTAPHGGVLVLFGDDHLAKSSTTAHQSEPALIAAGIPVLNPASIQEYLDLGVIAIELSRYAGCWVGMKCVADTVEGAASVAVAPNRVQLVTPTDFAPPDDVHISAGGFNPVAQEQRLMRARLPAAQAFVRANRLDWVTHDLPDEDRRIGIVATGKAWNDVVDALALLGVDDGLRRKLGLTLFKVAMPWPLEPCAVREYASGHRQLLVVEEKRPIIEDQLASILYKLADRPAIAGKHDEEDQPLLPADGELSAEIVAAALVGRIAHVHGESDLVAQLKEKIEGWQAPVSAGASARLPWFCSGCPHNTSTRVPDGSRVFAGIGCHTMAMWMPDRHTEGFTHMGGEGAQWIGQAPFSSSEHVFQNLGDGTYFHSGLMAVRAAVGAGVNITYKILFNDAVAMTGGQPVDGEQTPWGITRQLQSEGVKRFVVVTDAPEKYPGSTPWADGVQIRHRRELEVVQRELRATAGATVLLYDQTCAAEKRRRRKRGAFPDPDKRVIINELVCEGCGDCGVQSNCVSVQPLET